ncbi:MAG: serine/threonine protein kinase [Candidatus Melainabacteria bacterium]|nr:MAG: serine/threonine protein kinase [Candidatus Melainabacteria bacterium]
MKKRIKPEFELRPTRYLPEIRLLLLSSPAWLIPNIIPILGALFMLTVGLPLLPLIFSKVAWHGLIAFVPLFVLTLLLTDTYRITNRQILRGRMKKPINIDLIDEIGAIEANKFNDFKEEIFISTSDRKCSYLSVQDFKEDELRMFLAKLKNMKPDCKITYSDVIPLEARGLLKFLLEAQDEDIVNVELKHTQFEDGVINLIKSNERFFWIVYIIAWVVILFVAWLNTTLFQGIVPMIQNQVAPAISSSVNPYMLMLQTALSILKDMAVPIMTILWTALVMIFGVLIPGIRIFSHTYVFIGTKSVGVGMNFIPWQEITEVQLKKAEDTDDPLEGDIILVRDLTDTSPVDEQVRIELSRIPDLPTRQKAMRLIERYATNAKFNKEFLRTTTSITDIQFTELWLKESQQQSEAPKGEQMSICDGAESVGNGKYKVNRVLGYGGQGTTYLVSEEGQEEPKVVKELILPQYADVRIVQEATKRFERATEILGSLDHPKIVKLHESFIENGRAYIVLEFISGKTLRDIVNPDRTLSVDRICELGLQMCDILDYLHTREPAVLHCDFAPDNLILSFDSKIKLVDFDVARVANSTAFTSIAGRPSYTPPEQFRGEPDTRSDLYAMGAILKFLLTGQDPAPLSGGEIIITGTDPESRLKELINRLLAFEADQRPANALTVKEQLQLILSDSVKEPEAQEQEVIDIRMRDLA